MYIYFNFNLFIYSLLLRRLTQKTYRTNINLTKNYSYIDLRLKFRIKKKIPSFSQKINKKKVEDRYLTLISNLQHLTLNSYLKLELKKFNKQFFFHLLI